ncbi:MAG: ABC transporter ATP-binding protein [Proteobacteria bacterium]|nr:MAG: ABC transporter ATP-binding protein [Pseudomonadota bacterium]
MIEIKNVTKIFNEKSPREFCALKNVNLRIKKGEIALLCGVSGSGKSTLLSLIAGLNKPTSGEIIINKTSISKLPENFASRFRRKNIGIIFQNFNLIPTLSVLNNILLPTLVDGKNLSKKALDLLKTFQILDKKDVFAKNLSGGEAQRVAIARALINSPSLILCDEPTANLDESLSLKLLEHLDLIQSLGHTLIIASHDPLIYKWDKITKKFELQKVIK